MIDIRNKKAVAGNLVAFNLVILILALGCVAEKPVAYDSTTTDAQNNSVDVQSQNNEPAENATKSDNATAKSSITGFSTGSVAPDFKLTSSNHEVVTMSRLKGKNLLLNFWATWCDPCKRELPYLEYYYKQNTRNDLLIMTVCSDSTALSVNTYIMQANLTLPVLFDSNGKVRRLYSNQKNTLLVIPTTFLINSQGIIVKILRHQFTSLDDIENNVRAAGF